jgi:hypothetical protein
MDMLISRCNLGLVAGLLGISVQRMDVAQVAATRVSLSPKQRSLLARC